MTILLLSGCGGINNSNSNAQSTYLVNVTVTGLGNNSSLTLLDNARDKLVIDASGNYPFATTLPTGAAYNVTVSSAPAGESCNVSNASGIIATTNISTIQVACTATPSVSYTIGGNVSGLSGTLVVQNNGGNTTTLSADGPFTFSTPLFNQANYNVAISSQPSGQTCTVSQGSGSVQGAAVTTVSLSCVPNTSQTYSLGGNISWSPAPTPSSTNPPPPTNSLTLQYHTSAGNTSQTFVNSGAFVFTTPLKSGVAYQVSVLTPPSGQSCSVTNASGTMGNASISNLVVSCSTSTTYSVGGTLSGLTAGSSLVLLDNNSDPLSLSTNGNFSFPTQLASGALYSVTTGTAPTGQTCIVSQGNGSIATASISSVQVSCVATVALNSSPAVKESILYSLTSTDGMAPVSPLVLDAQNNLYGIFSINATSSSGGTTGHRSVLKITPAGVQSLLYTFAPGKTADLAPARIIMGTNNTLYGSLSDGGTNSTGLVFEINLTTGVESDIYSFGPASSTDGNTPVGALVLDSQNNLYGTTYTGGSNNTGTVFKITASGTESILYSFGGTTGTDGRHPLGGLIMDSNQNLYGTTSDGGTTSSPANPGSGTVFEFTAAGTEKLLHSFGTATNDGLNPAGNLVFDAQNNLYGSTHTGGVNNLGTLFKITPSGTESILYSFGATGTDAINPDDILMDNSGNFYGTTTAGGINNNGCLFQVTPAGKESVLYFFGITAADATAPYEGLSMDATGAFYGPSEYGGANNAGAIFKITVQ